jgi:hypothetical protein
MTRDQSCFDLRAGVPSINRADNVDPALA